MFVSILFQVIFCQKWFFISKLEQKPRCWGRKIWKVEEAQQVATEKAKAPRVTRLGNCAALTTKNTTP